MDRVKTPCCSTCKNAYNITDNKFKIPILLNCGHDICNMCLKYVSKTHKLIICEICQAHTRIEDNNQLNNLPIHYYLIGKLWSLNSYESHGLNASISRLDITREPSTSLKSNKSNCTKCQTITDILCQDCNLMYCRTCFKEDHLENKTYLQHKLIMLDKKDSKLSEELICLKHLKPLEYICCTCRMKLCEVCGETDHQNEMFSGHELVSFNTYNLYQPARLTQLTTAGIDLIQDLSSSRNTFYDDFLMYRKILKKKNSDLYIYKQNVSTFISSVVGSLQVTEQALLNLLNEAEKSVLDSMVDVIFKLNEFIHDLQDKVSTINQFTRSNGDESCGVVILDTIFAVESMLETPLKVARKNLTKPVVAIDVSVIDAVRRCVSLQIDDHSDTYILTDSTDLQPGYTSIINYHADDLGKRQNSSNSMTSSISNSATDRLVSMSLLNQVPDHLSVYEIVPHKIMRVNVTCVNSPSDFYLQLADNPLLEIVTRKMSGLTSTEAENCDTIKMSDVIYAVCLDQQFYRGVVVNMEIKNSVMVYTVFCIDYGFTSSLSANRIYRAPESVITIPPLAFHCALYSLTPSMMSGWSNAAINEFNYLILKKDCVLFVYPVNTQCDPLEVDILSCNKIIYPLSMRDAMFYLKHGCSHVPSNLELYEKLMELITLPKSTQLEKGNYKILVSHLISPSEFYFRIDDENSILLKDIMKKLQSKYQPTESDKNYLLYSPQIGLTVAAKYSIDNSWYRAKITCLPEPRMVNVFYIDYGNSETLPWDQLRVLDESFIKIPPLAIKACLADIKPAENGVETSSWTPKALSQFVQLTEPININNNTLTAYVQEVDEYEDDCGNNTHNVFVYNHWSRGEFCVNLKLVKEGLASCQNLDSVLFQKTNNRILNSSAPTKHTRTRKSETEVLETYDFLAFTKQRSFIESVNHSWEPTKKKNKDTPGIKMKVHKIISPDNIILKRFGYSIVNLTERMNTIYLGNKKTLKKTDWKVNDVCAFFIKRYGNWYRGKILEINTTTNTASVYAYDIDEMHNEIPMIILYSLVTSCSSDPCGFLHCSMSNLIPLGISESKWPKYSCDRLAEEIMKYSHVYFLRQGKNNDKVIGEIWVEDIGKPQALEPIHRRWKNMNRFMIEQGLAITDKKFKQDDEYSITSSESFNNSFETAQHTSSTNNCWLPPVPLCRDKCRLDVVPTSVDMQCNVYFRVDDHDVKQQLQEIVENLTSEFSNSSPEPVNYKWVIGQMVIVQYHGDQKWHRGTLTEILENNKFQVQFLDYGNIEVCTHEQLRSTLYMTDIPQLCVKGFLSTIGPLTEDKKWREPELDLLHSYIVDHVCTVVIDFDVSTNNGYAITRMNRKSETNPLLSDICQYMVSNDKAYFLYMDEYKCNNNMKTKKMDNSSNFNTNKNTFRKESKKKFSRNYTEVGDFDNTQFDRYSAKNTKEKRNDDVDVGQIDFNKQTNANNGNIVQRMFNVRINDYSCEEIMGEELISDITNASYSKDNKKLYKTTLDDKINDIAINVQSIALNSVQNSTPIQIDGKDAENINGSVLSNWYTNGLKEEDLKSKHENKLEVKRMKNSSSDLSDDLTEHNVPDTDISYSKISLKFNDVIEASLCRVVAPTCLILIIEKIGGVDMNICKEQMNEMLIKSGSLPKLDKIVSGTPVVVHHNFLWKRGIIVDGGKSVLLIDCGLSIKLVQRNLRLCPEEFMDQPMFSIYCQLAGVIRNKNVSAEDVMKKLTETLRNKTLKVAGIDNLDSDFVGVELYNNKQEIAYQSLIDSGMLIPFGNDTI